MLFFRQSNKPRKFGYTPRYYDPEAERREERRREMYLRGERTSDSSGPEQSEEYKPGMLLRTQGFRSRTGRQRRQGSGRPLRLILIIIALLVVSWLIVRWTIKF